MSLNELTKPKEKVQKTKHGPHGEVSISDLRDAIRASLSADLTAGDAAVAPSSPASAPKQNEEDDDEYEKDRSYRRH